MFEENPICRTCGTMYPREARPSICRICADDRQYVPRSGQAWTRLTDMRREGYGHVFTYLEPGVIGLQTHPSFAIGQRALLIQTPAGNVLWDPVSYLDDLTVDLLRGLGGIRVISASHPHFFASMVAFAESFACEIVLHEAHRPWVVFPSPRIRFVAEDATELAPNVHLVRLGGHFPGSSVLHLPTSAEGRGALLSGDTIAINTATGTVTFLYSFPHRVPLSAPAVARIRDLVAPYPFARLYDGWSVLWEDAKDVVLRSADRYLEALS
jgi:hypothetical protein